MRWQFLATEWPYLTIKLGFLIFIAIWIMAILKNKPNKVIYRGPVVKWLTSELAILVSILLIFQTSNLALSIYLKVTGCIFFYLALALYTWARIRLGPYWAEGIVLRENHRLIKDGPYRYFKHPIYISVLIAIASLCLIMGSLWGIVYTLIIVLPTLIIRAKEEERILLKIKDKIPVIR